MKNNIKKLRSSLGMTQAELAKKAGTSQQQVQRMEAGVQAAKLELAVKIARALDASLKEVFPKLQLKAIEKAKTAAFEDQPEKLEAAFATGGLDADPAAWTLRLVLTDGELHLFRVEASDRKRIAANLETTEPVGHYLVFDDATHRIAVRRSHIAFGQLCFDFHVAEDTNGDVAQPDPRLGPVQLFFSKSSEPFELEVDGDEVNDMEAAERDEDWQLNALFFDLEVGDQENVLQLVDEDGETAYIPTQNLLMIKVPLGLLEPRLAEAIFEGMEENGDI